MITAARLLYNERLNKTKIAARMGIDIGDVAPLLDAARNKGIVRISVFESVEGNFEQAIRDKYPHLERVMIVPGPEATTPAQCNELFRSFGRLASEYFVKMHERHHSRRPLHVGVTGGARLLEFENGVPNMYCENVHVHAAALVGRGRLRDQTSHIEPSVAASILWTHCGSFPGRCEYETVEPYRIDKTPGSEARKAVKRGLRRLEKTPSIERVIRDMDNLDIVFAGFGFNHRPEASEAMGNRITMGSLLESVVTPEMLAEEGVVGDFCYCPFDAAGECPSDRRWHFFLSAGHYSDHPGIEFFKHMVGTGKKVVGFGGPYLLPTIKAALKGKIVNGSSSMGPQLGNLRRAIRSAFGHAQSMPNTDVLFHSYRCCL